MRRTLFVLGMLALACAWFGPLPKLAQQAFFAHMTMHMTVVAIAAPLLALGIAGSLLDPVRKWPALFPQSRSRCWNSYLSGLGTLRHSITQHDIVSPDLRRSRDRFSCADFLFGWRPSAADRHIAVSARELG
jgi:Cytochrome c oxidase caa3 assembly factor (Caa3_CtaG)